MPIGNLRPHVGRRARPSPARPSRRERRAGTRRARLWASAAETPNPAPEPACWTRSPFRQHARENGVEFFQQFRVPGVAGGDEGVVQRAVGADRAGLCSAGKSRSRRASSARGFFGSFERMNRRCCATSTASSSVPAVEIGDHGDRGIGDFGLAGEFRLGHGGHADHIVAGDGRSAIRHRTRIAAPPCKHKSRLSRWRCFRHAPRRRSFRKQGRGRMGHRDMRDAAVAEEGGLPAEGAIDELVDENEKPRLELRLERTAGRDGNEVGDAGAFHRVDIGAVVDAGRREAWPRPWRGRNTASVARFVRSAAHPRVRPRASRQFPRVCLQTRQIIDPRAADNAEKCFGHEPDSLIEEIFWITGVSLAAGQVQRIRKCHKKKPDVETSGGASTTGSASWFHRMRQGRSAGPCVE